MQSTGNDETLHDADMFSAEFRPEKEPILSSHRNGSETAFEMVGIDWHVGIG